MKQTHPKRRPGTLAKVACEGCRRLKMKCITMAEDMPCVRCTKAKRQCVHPKPPSRPSKRITSSGPTPPITPADKAIFTDVRPDELTWTEPIVNCRTQVTRGYTESTIVSSADPSFSHIHSPHSLGYASSPTTPTSRAGAFFAPLGLNTDSSYVGIDLLQSDSSPILESHVSAVQLSSGADRGSIHQRIPVSPQEMNHLIWFFSMNLLSQLPLVTAEDMRYLATTNRTTSPLAISMAYVASQFVPGCKFLRSKLADAAAKFASTPSDAITDTATDDEQWNLLQALAILYTWAPSHSRPDHRIALTKGSLRLSIDSLIIRYAVFKSAQDVAGALRRSAHSDICNTFLFRKYLYWLWWYTESHFRSLISRTPSSLREDATITHAADLLRAVIADRRVHQILARVELCLIWFRESLRERHFGEWYCEIPNRLSPEEALRTLENIDNSLQLWSQRFHSSSQPQPPSEALAESTLGLYQHCIHFCNAVYTAQAFASSSGSKAAISDELELGALDRAWGLCNWFRSLNPLSKSAVGYSAEVFFTMIAFCCDYIIRVGSKSQHPRWSQRMSILPDVAQLMCEVSSDESHSAHVLGQRIMDSYTAARDVTPKQPARPRPASPQYQNIERLGFQHQSAGSIEVPTSSSYETSSCSASTNPSPQLPTLTAYQIPVSATNRCSSSWATHEAALNTSFDLATHHQDLTHSTGEADSLFGLTEEIDLNHASFGLQSSPSGPFWMQDVPLDTNSAFF